MRRPREARTRPGPGCRSKLRPLPTPLARVGRCACVCAARTVSGNNWSPGRRGKRWHALGTHRTMRGAGHGTDTVRMRVRGGFSCNSGWLTPPLV
eukprot:468149-Prymnesium_polylepis.1